MKVVHFIIPQIARNGVSWDRVNNIKRHLTQLCETYVTSSFSQGALDQLRQGDGGAFDCENVKPGWMAFPRDFQRVLREQKPNVVNLHGLWNYDTLAAAWQARKAKLPYIVNCYGMARPGAAKLPLWLEKLAFTLLYAKMLRHADTVFVTFDQEKDRLIEVGIAANKIIVLHGYINPEGIALKDDYELHRHLMGIVDLGQRPDIELLARSLTSASDGDKGYELTFVAQGTAAQLAELQEKLRAVAPLIPITALHSQSAALLDTLRHADAAVCLTLGEAVYPLIATAMAAGVPIVGLRHTMHGLIEAAHCGLVCDKKAASLYQTLVNMVHRSPQEREKMGRNGRRVMENDCSGEATAHLMFDAYTRALLR